MSVLEAFDGLDPHSIESRYPLDAPYTSAEFEAQGNEVTIDREARDRGIEIE